MKEFLKVTRPARLSLFLKADAPKRGPFPDALLRGHSPSRLLMTQGPGQLSADVPTAPRGPGCSVAANSRTPCGLCKTHRRRDAVPRERRRPLSPPPSSTGHLPQPSEHAQHCGPHQGVGLASRGDTHTSGHTQCPGAWRAGQPRLQGGRDGSSGKSRVGRGLEQGVPMAIHSFTHPSVILGGPLPLGLPCKQRAATEQTSHVPVPGAPRGRPNGRAGVSLRRRAGRHSRERGCFSKAGRPRRCLPV